MRGLVLLVVFGFFIYQFSTAKIVIRTKRQIEKEGDFGRNESTIIVNGDKELIDKSIDKNDEKDAEVMEIDFDHKDGTVSIGGRFPGFGIFPIRGFSNHFENAFRQMEQHFREMTRNMFERFNNTGAQYPANYNGTKEEIITVEGKQYIKKEHVVKKSDNNVNIFMTSTTYEPINDKNNES